MFQLVDARVGMQSVWTAFPFKKVLKVFIQLN